jgi:hypothetical protein
MVNAAHQLQKGVSACSVTYFRQQNLRVMPTSAVNDHVSISPKRIRQGGSGPVNLSLIERTTILQTLRAMQVHPGVDAAQVGVGT